MGISSNLGYHGGMKNAVRTLISDDRAALIAFAAISALALAGAYISQYGFGLQPCTLCHYQRVPYFIVIALGIAGIALDGKVPKIGRTCLGLTAGAFALNAVIAFYHSGVERHWWKSFLEGCAVPDMEGDITDVLARIAATPAARCDEIPWTDPVLGLSMANYNVMACLVLTIAALYALIARRAS